MTQTPNPYAQPIQPPPYAPPPVSRTSGLAIASLILSLIFCCPGLGLIGVLLGLFALGATGRPGVGGRGLAIAGILIGLLVSIGWGLLGFGMYRGFQMAMGEYKAKMQEFVADYNRGDYGTVYQWTDETFRRRVGRDEFDRFMGDLRSKWGDAEMIGILEMFKAFQSMPPHVQRQIEQQDQHSNTALLPVPVRFEKAGVKWVVLEIDAQASQDRLVIRRLEFIDFGALPRESDGRRRGEDGDGDD